MEQKNAVTLLSGKQWLLILLVSILLLGTVALMYSKFTSTKTMHAASTFNVYIYNNIPGITNDKITGSIGEYCADVDNGDGAIGQQYTLSVPLGTSLNITPYQGGGCIIGTALNYNASVFIPKDTTWDHCDVTFALGVSSAVIPVCK